MAKKSCCCCFDLRTGSTIIVCLHIVIAFSFLFIKAWSLIGIFICALVALYAIIKSNPLLLIPFMICQVLYMIYQLLLGVGIFMIYLLLTSDPVNNVQSNLEGQFEQMFDIFLTYSIGFIIMLIVILIISLVLSVYFLVVLIAMYKHLRKEISLKNNKIVVVPTAPNPVIASGVQLGQMENGQISMNKQIE